MGTGEVSKLHEQYDEVLRENESLRACVPSFALDEERCEINGKRWCPEAELRDMEARLAGVEREHERAEIQLIDERDRANDAIQDAHVALGGDGEWVAKAGQVCAAGETGDLAVDLPVLAAELRATIATQAEALRKAAKLVKLARDDIPLREQMPSDYAAAITELTEAFDA